MLDSRLRWNRLRHGNGRHGNGRLGEWRMSDRCSFGSILDQVGLPVTWVKSQAFAGRHCSLRLGLRIDPRARDCVSRSLGIIVLCSWQLRRRQRSLWQSRAWRTLVWRWTWGRCVCLRLRKSILDVSLQECLVHFGHLQFHSFKLVALDISYLEDNLSSSRLVPVPSIDTVHRLAVGLVVLGTDSNRLRSVVERLGSGNLSLGQETPSS